MTRPRNRRLVAAMAAVGCAMSSGVVANEVVEPEAPETRTHVFVARAYDPDTGRRLYDERHRVEYEDARPRRETVAYRTPSGRVFARKTLVYGDELAAPSFRFEDDRTGRVESVQRTGNRFVVAVRSDRDAAFETESLVLRGRVIVDEGYRMLLRGAWQRLTRGQAVVGEAVVPSRLASYGMRFRTMGSVRGTAGRRLRVRLDMDDFLLRMVGPSADLYFDPGTRRLVEFVGMANIRDADGDLQEARILYRYGPS